MTWQWIEGDDRDLTWVGAGDPLELLIGLGHGIVVVAEPDIWWPGPSAPELRLGPASTFTSTDPVEDILEAVGLHRLGRVQSFETCGECGKTLPPEWMGELLGGPQCHSCMTTHGVVF